MTKEEPKIKLVIAEQLIGKEELVRSSCETEANRQHDEIVARLKTNFENQHIANDKHWEQIVTHYKELLTEANEQIKGVNDDLISAQVSAQTKIAEQAAEIKRLNVQIRELISCSQKLYWWIVNGDSSNEKILNLENTLRDNGVIVRQALSSKEEMVRCPKWQICKRFVKCPHKEIHARQISSWPNCNTIPQNDDDCPTCVPVEDIAEADDAAMWAERETDDMPKIFIPELDDEGGR
jgi:hypothetical protein